MGSAQQKAIANQRRPFRDRGKNMGSPVLMVISKAYIKRQASSFSRIISKFLKPFPAVLDVTRYLLMLLEKRLNSRLTELFFGKR